MRLRRRFLGLDRSRLFTLLICSGAACLASAAARAETIPEILNRLHGPRQFNLHGEVVAIGQARGDARDLSIALRSRSRNRIGVDDTCLAGEYDQTTRFLHLRPTDCSKKLPVYCTSEDLGIHNPQRGEDSTFYDAGKACRTITFRQPSGEILYGLFGNVVTHERLSSFRTNFMREPPYQFWVNAYQANPGLFAQDVSGLISGLETRSKICAVVRDNDRNALYPVDCDEAFNESTGAACRHRLTYEWAISPWRSGEDRFGRQSVEELGARVCRRRGHYWDFALPDFPIRMGRDLWSVNNRAERSALVNLFRHKVSSGKDWFAEYVEPIDWAEGEPSDTVDGAPADCAMYRRDGKIKAAPCDAVKPFMCHSKVSGYLVTRNVRDYFSAGAGVCEDHGMEFSYPVPDPLSPPLRDEYVDVAAAMKASQHDHAHVNMSRESEFSGADVEMVIHRLGSQVKRPARHVVRKGVRTRAFVRKQARRKGLTTGVPSRIQARRSVTLRSASSETIPTSKKRKDSRWLSVHVFNVGAGNCVWIERPIFPDILVDCGQTPAGRGPQDLTQEAVHDVVKALRVEEGVAAAVDLLISHPHADHYNFVTGVLDNPKSRVLDAYLGGYWPAYPETLKGGGPRYHFGLGNLKDWTISSRDLEGSATVTIIEANAHYRRHQNPHNPNDDSAVLLIEFGRTFVLIMGDAARRTEEQVAESLAGHEAYQQAEHRILVASHHGARTQQSNSLNFFAAARPTHVVFSAGTANGHPNSEALTNLLNTDSLRLAWLPHAFTSYRETNVADSSATFSLMMREVYNTEDNGRVSFYVSPSGLHSQYVLVSFDRGGFISGLLTMFDSFSYRRGLQDLTEFFASFSSAFDVRE